MATTERHAEISDRLLRQAMSELEEGDTIQASEKAWGAMAHFVKSVAVERGWEHETHRDVNRCARRLVMLTSDVRRNATRLGLANALHQNFYEDWFDADTVRDGIEDVGDLVAAMREVYENGSVEQQSGS